jgi:hypothetical protein
MRVFVNHKEDNEVFPLTHNPEPERQKCCRYSKLSRLKDNDANGLAREPFINKDSDNLQLMIIRMKSATPAIREIRIKARPI